MNLAKQYLSLSEQKVNEELPIKLQTALEKLSRKPNQIKAELANNLLNDLISLVSQQAAGQRLLKDFASGAYDMVVRGEDTETDSVEV